MVMVPWTDGDATTPQLIPSSGLGAVWFTNIHTVRLTDKLYFFNQRIIFFFYNKLANSTFNHGLSAKRTGLLEEHVSQCLSIEDDIKTVVIAILPLYIHD